MTIALQDYIGMDILKDKLKVTQKEASSDSLSCVMGWSLHKLFLMVWTPSAISC